MVLARIPLETVARAAAVDMLAAYAAAANIKLQVYAGRPRSLLPPTAFVDAINEQLTDYTVTHRQRTVQVQVMVLHGTYDSADTASQRDTFVDGFADYVADDYHAAGPNTLVAVTAIEDVPEYVPTWMPVDQQRVYYGTRITLEGFAAT